MNRRLRARLILVRNGFATVSSLHFSARKALRERSRPRSWGSAARQLPGSGRSQEQPPEPQESSPTSQPREEFTRDYTAFWLLVLFFWFFFPPLKNTRISTNSRKPSLIPGQKELHNKETPRSSRRGGTGTPREGTGWGDTCDTPELSRRDPGHSGRGRDSGDSPAATGTPREGKGHL